MFGPSTHLVEQLLQDGQQVEQVDRVAALHGHPVRVHEAHHGQLLDHLRQLRVSVLVQFPVNLTQHPVQVLATLHSTVL